LQQNLLKKLAILSLIGGTLSAQNATMTNTDGLTLNVNFGGWSGDYFAELFVPPADGYAVSIDFGIADLPDVSGGSMSVAIFAANYPWDDIDEENIADTSPDCWLGYFNNNDTLGITGNNWVFGGINALVEADSGYQYDPLGEQLWPANGFATIPLQPNDADEDTVTLDLENSAFGPFYFEWAEPFIVVVKLTGFEDQTDQSEYRVGFLSGNFPLDPPPSLKFYNTISAPNGRTGINDWGWHIRSYIWDWSVHVEYASGPPPYRIELEQLPVTLTSITRVVTARILPEQPSGDHTVVQANLHYSVDGQTHDVLMEYHEAMYLGILPAQTESVTMEYWVTIELANGHTLVSDTKTYSVFFPDGAMLFVYDAEDLMASTAQYLYNRDLPMEFTHDMDMWEARFGPITPELVEHYELIYHVMGGGPANDARLYSDIYTEWLDQGTNDYPKRLMISGQDYGAISGYADTTFPADAFENHYLGIETLGPQDVTYGDPIASINDAYPVDAVENNLLTGLLSTYAGDSLQLYHDPFRELGFPNWVDNLTPSSGTVCFTDPGFNDAAMAVYNSGEGWKTAFWALDPLALSYYAPSDTTSMYHWALEAVGNPVAPTFEWFGPRTQVNIEHPPQTPARTNLHKNYPNPFNPVTTIAYELDMDTEVSLKVFNLLGQEVVSLVESPQKAGTYSIEWRGVNGDGKQLPSGVYFYTLDGELPLNPENDIT